MTAGLKLELFLEPIPGSKSEYAMRLTQYYTENDRFLWGNPGPSPEGLLELICAGYVPLAS